MGLGVKGLGVKELGVKANGERVVGVALAAAATWTVAPAQAAMIDVEYRATLPEAYAPLARGTHIDFYARYDTDAIVDHPTGDYAPAVSHELLLNDVPAAIELVRFVQLPGGRSLFSAQVTQPLLVRFVLEFQQPEPDPFDPTALTAADANGLLVFGSNLIDLDVSYVGASSVQNPAPATAAALLVGGLVASRRRR
ncbi:MAG: hypothetical protein AAGK04_12120 [Planctomycetota bacterium]